MKTTTTMTTTTMTTTTKAGVKAWRAGVRIDLLLESCPKCDLIRALSQARPLPTATTSTPTGINPPPTSDTPLHFILSS
jgi:hypothetical protein